MAIWMDAWHDPVAAIHTSPSCIRLVDVTGDGDPKLLVADQNRKLRLYKGMNLVSEHALLDTPSAICAFYEETKNSATRVPSLAVACGQFIFIYKKLRPHYKFTLPAPPVSEVEIEIWKELYESRASTEEAQEKMATLRESGTLVTHQAIDFLSIDDEAKREEFKESVMGKLPTNSTTITCLESINKSSEDEGSTSCLVVGTESQQVVILDASGFSIMVKESLPSVPAFLCTSGLLDVEYRIIAACRTGTVYMIKNGKLMGTSIELEARPCAMAVSGKNIIVGCMQNVLHSFHMKGKKNYSVHQPAAIHAIENMVTDQLASEALQLVALGNGEVRMYKGKALMSIISNDDSVSAVRFGKYAREDAALLCTFKTGGLAIKLLSRKSNLSKSTVSSGPPPEQDMPLNVPKKTKLYVEQTQRERDQSVDMHRIFQRDLCKLRLNTARAYVRMLTDGQGQVSFTSTATLRINAEVRGLGPAYKIAISLSNSGSKQISGCPLLIKFNPHLYAVDQPLIELPAIVPGPQYRFDVAITCIERQGGCDAVQVCVCNPKSAIPILSALINMPVCDPIEE